MLRVADDNDENAKLLALKVAALFTMAFPDTKDDTTNNPREVTRNEQVKDIWTIMKSLYLYKKQTLY